MLSMKSVLIKRKEKTFVVSEGRGVLPGALRFVSNSQLRIQTYFTSQNQSILPEMIVAHVHVIQNHPADYDKLL